jgi:hypothetical protein
VNAKAAGAHKQGVIEVSGPINSDGVSVSSRPDWFGWLCLGAFALLSITALAPLLLSGRTITGADGLFPPDQLQYLTWIREASNHVLIGNRFDFQPDSRVFLHPGFLLSGMLHRVLGVDLQTAYLAPWKPLAVGIGFLGCWLYTRRLLQPGWPQRIGLLLALFAVMPWSALAKVTGWGGPPRQYTLDFISGEMWSGQTLFGYMLTATAVFMLPLVLLGVERLRGDSNRLGLLTACCLGGGWIMWVQPWQGAELIAILIFVEAFRWVRSQIKADPRVVLVCSITGLPAIYYAVIAATDSSWRLAGKANAAGAQPLWSWPLWAVVLSLAPLALPALIAFKDRSGNWQQLAVRAWPIAVLVVYFQPFGTFPYHALQGLTLPLSVLSVQAFTTHRPKWLCQPQPWLIVVTLFLLIVPGTVHKVNLVRESIHKVSYPYYLFSGEQQALRFLESDARPGGVLADSYGGLLIPPFSGREAYLGPFSWTPNWQTKANQSGRFFAGQMAPTEAKAFVQSSGARFVFQECAGRVQPPRSLSSELDGLIAQVHSFGCARVYVIEPSSRSDVVSAETGSPVR